MRDRERLLWRQRPRKSRSSIHLRQARISYLPCRNNRHHASILTRLRFNLHLGARFLPNLPLLNYGGYDGTLLFNRQRPAVSSFSVSRLSSRYDALREQYMW